MSQLFILKCAQLNLNKTTSLGRKSVRHLCVFGGGRAWCDFLW